MNKVLDDFVKKEIQRMIHYDMNEWPPGCFALSYQPQRPAKKAVVLHTDDCVNRRKTTQHESL